MRSTWFAVGGVLCAGFLFIASAPQASAQSACIYSCTNGSSTQAMVADCGTCKSTCFSGCASSPDGNPRAGCYAWRCGTQSESPNGDNCPVDLLNRTSATDRANVAASIQDKSSTRQVSTGLFSCRTPLDAGDQGQNCLSQSVCSGGRSCCVPIDRRTCSAVIEANAPAGQLTSVRNELSRVEASTASQRANFYCQNVNRDAANQRCFNLSGPEGCPNQPGMKCCAPEEAIGGIGCGLAAGAPNATQVTQLQDRSRTQPSEWFCQRPGQNGVVAATHCLATNSLCRGQFKCCVTAAARGAMTESAGLPPTTSCVERAARAGNRSQIEGDAAAALDQARTAAGNPPNFNTQYSATSFECLRACLPADAQRYCVGGGSGCDGAGVQCCLPTALSRLPAATAQNVCPTGTTGSGGAAGAAAGGAGLPGTSGSSGAGAVSGRLTLPACISDGRCELSDILRTGASFANFLFELSGAIFLLMFVVGGIYYLLSGVDASYPKKGKEYIVTSAIGMIIIFGAASIVRYVYNAFTQVSDPTTSTCERQYAAEGFRCTYVAGDTPAEIARSVDQQACKSETNLCNLQGQDQNIRCCPVYGAGEAAPLPANPYR